MIGRVCTACRHFALFYTKKLADRRSDREKFAPRARACVERVETRSGYERLGFIATTEMRFNGF